MTTTHRVTPHFAAQNVYATRDGNTDLWLIVHELCRHQPAKDVHEQSFLTVRTGAMAFLDAILRMVPPSAERSAAITRLREALMWAIGGLVFHGTQKSDGSGPMAAGFEELIETAPPVDLRQPVSLEDFDDDEEEEPDDAEEHVAAHMEAKATIHDASAPVEKEVDLRAVHRAEMLSARAIGREAVLDETMIANPPNNGTLTWDDVRRIVLDTARYGGRRKHVLCGKRAYETLMALPEMVRHPHLDFLHTHFCFLLDPAVPSDVMLVTDPSVSSAFALPEAFHVVTGIERPKT